MNGSAQNCGHAQIDFLNLFAYLTAPLFGRDLALDAKGGARSPATRWLAMTVSETLELRCLKIASRGGDAIAIGSRSQIGLTRS
jgi:hypothetical protein